MLIDNKSEGGDMSCSGSEASLFDCDFEWNSQGCSKSEDVYLVCAGNPAFKLYGGESEDRVSSSCVSDLWITKRMIDILFKYSTIKCTLKSNEVKNQIYKMVPKT